MSSLRAGVPRPEGQVVGVVGLLGDLLGPGSRERHAAVLLDGMAAFMHPRLILESADQNRETELKRVLQTLLRGLAG